MIFVLGIMSIGAYYALWAGPYYALLLYIWNAYFRPEEWVWTDTLRNMDISSIIGWYVIFATVLSKQHFILNRRIILIFLFLFHTLLSTLFSKDFAYSWAYWTDFLKSTLITYLIVVLVVDFSKMRLLLLVMVSSLGFEAAKQGWVYLITSPGWANPNDNPFLGDNNGVAVGMLMLVPVIALLSQTTHRRWTQPFYWFLLIGLLYRALSTYSRGGFLAVIALAASYWLRSHHRLRTLLGIVIVTTLVLPTLPDAFWNRMSTILTYEEDDDRSALGRFHMWKVAIEMAKANPVLGVGYNAYNEAYDDYDFSKGEYGLKRSVHNSFLGALAELGYPGAVLYGLILFSAFRSCCSLRRLAKKDPSLLELGQCAIALETSLVVFLVGGFFVILQYNEMLWHFIGITIVLERLAVQAPSYDLGPAPSSAPLALSYPQRVANYQAPI